MPAIVDLAGKCCLVAGIANDHSLAAGCATAFREAGADLAITYLNEQGEPDVQPMAEACGTPIIVPYDVRIPGQLEAVFDTAANKRRLDFYCIRLPLRRERRHIGSAEGADDRRLLVGIGIMRTVLQVAPLQEPQGGELERRMTEAITCMMGEAGRHT